jgi:hypothetical protein
MKLETTKRLITLYTKFRDTIYYPKSVLYTSSGYDASPAHVFPNVTFVDAEDGNAGCIDALKQAGLKAVKSDVRKYRPTENHDLLLLQNPVVPASYATPHLSKRGYVLANNYHGTARELAQEREAFEFVAGLDVKDDKVTVVRDLSGYFEPVADLEEFRRLRPDDYEFETRTAENFAVQGIINCKPDAPLDEKFQVYREEMGFKMPSRKVADYYLFIKI